MNLIFLLIICLISGMLSLFLLENPDLLPLYLGVPLLASTGFISIFTSLKIILNSSDGETVY